MVKSPGLNGDLTGYEIGVLLAGYKRWKPTILLKICGKA
jgi:hypothetical protein